ncbi:hypothetical protein A3K01_00280 [candidate division WWE3 bacterium RIFOXYD1_FULL_43_17]|uniref:Uncharacterized protein n=3 Tax=Katanobacteria TaxID=422282 RepID=A0A1F4XDJ9_UNCKA|nr:MAG: hypothetical protein UU59_C0005G0014 [candidate division WWE3 bacterium GW2011_GWE1_41_27]KKS60682.1 MAG: hypothetical protein UV26_C0002G0008 [candidate division WWE3 bacterium GW2011_GWF2_42_42]OGC79223.1 MAG: hypothetical protein A3K01_00280 [candidate division WWE3 bacterium RIFOXYD1_FULL_43_17]
MKKILLAVGAILLILIPIYLYLKFSTPGDVITPKNNGGVIADKEYIFEELGISLSVPENLHVNKSPNFNATTGKLESYTFYIQNYGDEDGPPTKYFQIYGLYQPDLPETTFEDLALMKDDTENYEYVKEFSAGTLQGFEVKQKGERANYSYSLLFNGRVLRITVSEGTVENKTAAEKIIKTLKVLQPVTVGENSETAASVMGEGYNFSYPTGWTATKVINGTTVTSPDYKISEGFPILEAGAELAVFTKKAGSYTIKEDLATNPITSKIPNKTDVVVAEQNAVRYEYDYEGVRAVMTEFIYDGIRYSLRYRFVDEASKNTYMGVYEEMLRTFELL